MPRYLFDGKSYPTYVNGLGYAMDRAAASCIYKEAMELPYLFIEDVFVNGFARQACNNVRIVHSKAFMQVGFRLVAVTGKEVPTFKNLYMN